MGIARLWIETDIGNDVDDMGALAVAHALTDAGEAEIVGIGINMPDPRAAGAVAAVNAFYGRPDTLVAVMPPGEGPFDETYAHAVTDRFGDDPSPERPPAPEALRDALDASEPGALTIVSIGLHHNLVALLDQPGGREAIVRAAPRTIVMAGIFPEGGEFNLAHRPEPAKRFVREWPTPIEFLGFEVGDTVISGAGLDWPDAADNPVALAYDYYNGPGNGRSSWDPLTVDYAVRGEDGVYALSEPGTLELDDAAQNVWRPDPEGSHRHLRALVDDATLARRLDTLLSAPPRCAERRGDR